MPKGGGRKAFLKGVRHDSDSEQDDKGKAAQPSKQPKQPSAPKPNKADAFLIDAPLPTPPAAAPAPAPPQGSDSDAEGDAQGTETRGQMVQRHKRVCKNSAGEETEGRKMRGCML